MGNYGKGKIFTFGHPGLFDRNLTKQATNQRLLKNLMQWMVGEKNEVSIGYLFTGWWNNSGWDNLDRKLSYGFVEKIEDLKNKDIICVTYYGRYPQALTPELLNKLK